MAKKFNRAHSPSWTEVILGAFLSLLLGVVLGAGLLILRPVVQAREEPKERQANRVYYIDGSSMPGRAREAAAKRQAFIEGQSVTVNEDEINALIGSTSKAAPAANPAAASKAGKDGAADSDGGIVSPGKPTVRIRDGVLQVGVPVTIAYLDQRIIAQAQGGFVKRGDLFVYEPDVLYIGSCPVQRLPLVAGYVRNLFLNAQPIPDDIKAAWAKLANASVEGNVVKLTMP